jgi:hypothetical protein
MTSGAKSEDHFGKKDFVYLPTEDRCPAGQKLSYHYTNEEDGKTLRRYWTTACPGCPLKSQCTTGSERRITRWEHEHVLEAVQQRLEKNPQAMRLRRETVSLRYAQDTDGRDAFSDEASTDGCDRNVPTHTRL